ncbi:peptidylprolyl isomerase [Reichenbachiella agariperforans]|uniref:Periplasmic chaperone PpiD n=1 Tax=Reichenbachiella agariperforans TaxID=156994 RepID=A0A1M6TNB3_REIAG|nr:peptidylprolyl isomerase [Reichenbachiella agariperforans]MBU2915505.1 SurA N-terminal domain-containing protein [Reichenbachiella agariperforans]SHK58379.1 peptidyl-prolyl cis-trans isomerase D [Reichenbachiella agariperforans]
MALINTLRNKGGKIIVGLIGFSIVAFVGADLLGPNSRIFGGSNDIGEIAGQSISYQDFLDKQEEMTYNFQLNQGRSPSASEQEYIRNQTWDALISKYAFENQFQALGLKISKEEIVDMVQGDNISPQIRQAFTNPETGQFEKENVIAFLQSLNEQTPQQRASWYNFENSLAPTRQRTKYNNLILKTNYATEAEAKYEYTNANNTAEVNYIYVPFSSVEDSLVSVSESELKAYLSDHEDEYKRDASKAINYVVIDVVPSAADTLEVKTQIDKLATELANAENDSLFATVNSDSNDPYNSYAADKLPSAVQDAVVGDVVGPVIESGSYVVYKVSGKEAGEEYSARASHILFKADGDTDAAKATAKSEARKVLKQIKNGADFAEMAREHGTDGTASKGGDLGWFGEGRMVAPFQEAVFNAKKTGLLSDVIETQFGYHIIDVTALKTNEKLKVAKVALELFVSDDTRNEYYRNAESFAFDTNSSSDFKENARAAGMSVKSAGKLGANDKRLPGLAEARTIVYWAYNKASVGDVSDVFEIDNQYVVATLESEQEEGVANLSSVRNEVTKKVTDAKKAKVITDKLNSIDEPVLANRIIAYDGNNVKYYSMDDLKLSSNSLKSVGLAPKAVGVAFSLEPGEVTAPFAVENGVVQLELINKHEAPEISDYEVYRNQAASKQQSRLSYNIDQAVRELADIKDERYKFF